MSKVQQYQDDQKWCIGSSAASEPSGLIPYSPPALVIKEHTESLFIIEDCGQRSRKIIPKLPVPFILMDIWRKRPEFSIKASSFCFQGPSAISLGDWSQTTFVTFPYIWGMEDRISFVVFVYKKEDFRLELEYERKLKLKIGFWIWLKFLILFSHSKAKSVHCVLWLI